MAGEGSVFRRKSDGAWCAQVSIGPRGQRRYVTRSLKTRAQAVATLRELQSARTPTKLTVGVFLEQWVHDVRGIRPNTRHGYEAAIVTHLAPAFGGLRLGELAPVHVERWLAASTLHPKTLRNAHAVLRRALNQALRLGLVDTNVAGRQYVDVPKVTVAEPRALSAAEIGRLLTVCRGSRLGAAVVVAVGTGLRQGELLGLAWEDVTDTGIYVRKELVRRNGKYERDEPKTPSSKRFVPLAPSVAAAIAEHRERLIAEGFVPTSTGPVFVNTKGKALNGSWLTHHFYALLEEAGINRLPFKNLRTTFASRLYDAGVPDATIAQLMGHSRTHTTRRHYIETTPEQAVAAVERLVSQSPNQSPARGAVGGSGVFHA